MSQIETGHRGDGDRLQKTDRKQRLSSELVGDQANRQAYSLHRGRSRKAIVRVIPDGIVFRIEWPDIGPSAPANLTRCMSAAVEWAERSVMTEQRKNSVARRLKSLDNFWWSASPVRQNEQIDADWLDWPADVSPAHDAARNVSETPTAPAIEGAV